MLTIFLISGFVYRVQIHGANSCEELKLTEPCTRVINRWSPTLKSFKERHCEVGAGACVPRDITNLKPIYPHASLPLQRCCKVEQIRFTCGKGSERGKLMALE